MGKQKSAKSKKLLLSVLAALLLIGAILIGWVSYVLFYPNFSVEKTTYIYVDEKRDFEDLCRQLADSAGCKSLTNFRLLAKWMKYPQNMKTGRYEVTSLTNNTTLLKDLLRAHQEPVRISFNNIRTKEELAERLSDQLMFSKEDLLTLLDDSVYCDSIGFTTETVKAAFIPNTYEVYWNTSAPKLMQRMQREYETFWTDERRQKAENIGFSPVEVSILASIVEEETAAPEEYPMVAGLYINRLQMGMPLQADPTVKYAVGNFGLRRILFEHLTVDSPYNTYKYTGLPPGPLRVSTIKGLDGVLNYARHHYIYMCAKEDFSGRHNFAVTWEEHTKNANRYREALNKRGIQ